MLNYVLQILFILKDARIQLLFLVFLFVLTSVLEAVGIGMVGPFLWLASNVDRVDTIPVLSQLHERLLVGKENLIAGLGIILAILFCVKAGLNFLVRSYIYRFSLFQRSLVIDKLLKAYLSAPYSFFLSDRNTAAGLVSRMTYDTMQFCHYGLVPFLDFVSNSITTIVLILLLVRVDPILLLLISAVLLPTFLGVYLLKSRAVRWGKEASDSYEDMVRTLQNSVGAIKEIRLLGCAPYFELQMQSASKRNVSSVTKAFEIQTLPRIVVETLVIVLVLMTVSLYQIFFARQLEDIIPVLSIFAVASVRLIPSYSQSLASWGIMQTSMYSVDVLYADLKGLSQVNFEAPKKLVATPTDRDSKMELSPAYPLTSSEFIGSEKMLFSNMIELHGIVYSYPGASQPSLNDISLTIPKGSSIALIGRSGAGKTTLVDLMLGLLEPVSGDLTVDGISIYKDLRLWQNLVGYIPQSINLVDDTIEHNVAFGVPDHEIDHTRLHHALELAQLAELVKDSPEGVRTQIGDRGIRLSGGQRQRIGIARALYHQREILVLDEATAALDNETERLVMESIRALLGQKTIIIIAHRLSTVRHCDCIYMLEKGEIIKSGSYDTVVGG